MAGHTRPDRCARHLVRAAEVRVGSLPPKAPLVSAPRERPCAGRTDSPNVSSFATMLPFACCSVPGPGPPPAIGHGKAGHWPRLPMKRQTG
jgi:hypothetical protein